MEILRKKYGKNYANRSKKGSIFDVILLMILPLIFILLVVAVYVAYTKTAVALNDALPTINNNVVNATDATNSYVNVANSYASYWDIIMIFVIFGMWFGVLISAYLLGNNPIFLIVYAVLSIALFVLSVYIQFSEQSIAVALDEYFSAFPITSFFIQYSMLFSILFIVSTGVALYMKPQNTQ